MEGQALSRPHQAGQGAWNLKLSSFMTKRSARIVSAVKAVLAETGLPVIGMNVRMGDTAGCGAQPGQEAQFRRDIEAAIAVAETLDCPAIHVLSGKSEAGGSEDVLVANLQFALQATERVLLIEPLCRARMAGYFLHEIGQARRIVDRIGNDRLKIMFDCFHIETESGDVLKHFTAHAAHVGHVQIAGVPNRDEPTDGGVRYSTLLPALQAGGYGGYFGCEYTPAAGPSGVAEGLGWRDRFVSRAQA